MKLCFNLIKKALICVLFSGIIGTSITLIFVLLLKRHFDFMSGWCYLSGALFSIFTCLVLRKYVHEKGYFTSDELKGHNLWVNYINNKKPITKQTLYFMLMPYLILGIIIIVIICVFHKELQAGGSQSYLGFAAICSSLSSIAASLIVYALISLRSYKICKHCGAVNAFIYDDNAEHISTTNFGDYRTAGWAGKAHFGGVRAITKNSGDCIKCHCSNCMSETIIIETSGSEWSGL